MKTIYFIRHAKTGWSIPNTSDFEREVSKKGKRDIKTMGSYLALRGIKPDLILSSCALRAQETTDLLAEKIHKLEYENYPEIIHKILKKL